MERFKTYLIISVWAVVIGFIFLTMIAFIAEQTGLLPAQQARVSYHTTSYGLQYVTYYKDALPGETRTIWVDADKTEVEALKDPLPEGFSLVPPNGDCEWITVGTTAKTQYWEKVARYEEDIKFCD